MPNNYLSHSYDSFSKDSKIQSNHYLLDRSRSARRGKSGYIRTHTNNKIKQILHKYNKQKQPLNLSQNKQNLKFISNDIRGHNKKVKANVMKKEHIGQRILELEGINMKIKSMIDQLKDDFEQCQSNKQECQIISSKMIQKQKGLVSQSRICNLLNDSNISSRFNSLRNKDSHPRALKTTISTQKSSRKQKRNENNKLIRRLCKQVKYDVEFMNAKQRLSKKNVKVEDLWRMVNDVDSSLPNSCKCSSIDMLEVNQEQMDPFYTQRQEITEKKNDKQLIASLKETYKKCHQYWHAKIYKKFCSHHINISHLDLQKKGEIRKEDIARFLSIHSKNLYCNRDVCLIYQRIKNCSQSQSQSISLQQWFDNFCI